MKIALKNNITFRNGSQNQINELNFIYIHFGDKELEDQFLLNIIDYDKIITYEKFANFFDQIEYYPKQEILFVLHLDENSLVLTPDECESKKPKFQISPDDLEIAIKYISFDNDFHFLKNEALKSPHFDQRNIENEKPEMPTLIDFIRRNIEDFKVIYYPGAGLDFSALQLFGNLGTDVEIFYSDYMGFSSELKKALKNLHINLKTKTELKPNDFGKTLWTEFWPIDYNLWIEHYNHPDNAWGSKFFFSLKENKCSFTYLGTEGVQTVANLIENKIIPDVLILQDHGMSLNYALFSGNNSPLHKAMMQNLPKYILMDPTGAENTNIWSGYKQITQPYQPEVYLSLPQNKKPRALFKKVIDFHSNQNMSD
jgi:hypothetical protein